ncbi:MAG: type IV pilus modification PilV family protein [Chloroflexota bacterium]
MIKSKFQKLFGLGRSSTGGGPRRQRGFLLAEAMVALAIVSTAVVASFGAISTTSLTTSRVTIQNVAESVAISQAEAIQAEAYVSTGGEYPSVSTPDGYTVENETSTVDDGDENIQTVTVTVFHNGSQVLETEIIKVNR